MADLFDIVTARKLSGGGGGGTTVEALSVTQNGTYTAPSGKAYSPVSVNVSGGSSDFSTATVTVVNPNTVQVEGFYASVFEDGEMAVAYLGDSSTYPVVIYKEGIYLQYNGATISVSGNAELYSDRYIYVTGDCTITIS